MYQGQEQHVTGNYSPYNRGALWTTGYDSTAPLYNLTSTLNTIRNHAITIDSRYITNTSTALYLDDSTYATRKGPEGAQVVAVFSNQGSLGGDYDLVIPGAFAAGTEVMELVNCTKATANEAGNVTAQMSAGLPRVFYPSFNLNGSGLCGTETQTTTENGTATSSGAGATATKKSAGVQLRSAEAVVAGWVVLASMVMLML